MRFQRIIQTISLCLFLTLLVLAGTGLPKQGLADFFLRMDPLIGLGTVVAARNLLLTLWPGLAVVLLTLVLGRVFCGHLCPMGTTLDILSSPIKGARKRRAHTNAAEADGGKRSWKYLFLVLIMVGAIFGTSLVHLGSPLSWATRIWGLLLYPIALIGVDESIYWAGGILNQMGYADLLYIQAPQRVFLSGLFVAAFIGLMCALLAMTPRFWCRYLCPAGAILAIFSRKPVIRRRVNSDCIDCGQCVAQCPTGAIPEDQFKTLHHECVVCLKCRDICPVSAISFDLNPGPQTVSTLPASLDRRAVLYSVAAGIVAAGAIRTSARRPEGAPGGVVWKSGDLIRPPGSAPEREFLRLCVRCGECMKACPTNTLQPVWFMAGPEGIFSPVLKPRLGPCALNCNECGKVCPTGAIRYLPLIEKQSVKMGSAWIIRRNCLVWEQDRKCLVCDEVCPYNALSFRPVKGLKNAAPFVIENRCTGCGWCENKCPVLGWAAIRVNIIGEVRLLDGSYIEKARQLGFVFKTRDNSHDELASGTFDGLETGPPDEGPAEKPDKDPNKDLPEGFILE